jgi:hypothetical protein
MDCKERILSNNYVDIITEFPIRMGADDDVDLCYTSLSDEFTIAYINRLNIPPLPENLYDYRNMPKLYGLADTTPSGFGVPVEPFDSSSLEAAGIIQIQRQPLSLTGNGVVLCFIDTGDSVTLLLIRYWIPGRR